jgi:hypothetical protein
MKHLFLALLLATLCSATSYGQTIKTLGYNTTNGQVIANTGTNVLTFTNVYGVQAYSLVVGNTNLRASFYVEDEGLGMSVYRTNTETYIGNIGFTNNSILLAVPISFQGTNTTAVTRTNLGLPLPALTNTSNVTTMRALSGSTNTNHPFSGSVSVVGTNNTNTLVFSNGILQSMQ